MTIRPVRTTALLLLATGLTACAPAPSIRHDPALSVRRIAPAEPASPFAWSRDGARVASCDDGVVVTDLGTGVATRLTRQSPTALAWSSDDRLAVASPSGELSALRILDSAGSSLARVDLAGDVRWVDWTSDGVVVATTTQVVRYSFGGHLLQTLAVWDGEGEPTLTPPKGVTLDTTTLTVFEHIRGLGLRPTLGPLRDEVVLCRLHDPPALPPNLEVVLHHMASGMERSVARVDPTGPCAVPWPDGDTIAVPGGEAGAQRLDPWTGESLPPPPLWGTSAAVSPDGRLAWVDGRLVSTAGGGQPLIEASPSAEAAFAPGGARLLVRTEDALYLVEGLPAGPSLTPPSSDDLLRLRRWRAEGLITPADLARELQGSPAAPEETP